jgi:alcohol dehydrogenase YqhD (iron-dependent ADH family)
MVYNDIHNIVSKTQADALTNAGGNSILDTSENISIANKYALT